MKDEDMHSHPNRHRKALRSALILAAVGVVVLSIGLVAIVMGSSSGMLIGLMVVGVTILLLAPVWYFTYMESLEPELYQHD